MSSPSKATTTSSSSSSFDPSDTFIPRIVFKTLFASLYKNFTCNKQLIMAESVRMNEPNNSFKHTVLVSLYNTCMSNFVNREFESPIETSKTPHVNKNNILDLDLAQLERVSEEVFKTKNDEETQQKITELFDGEPVGKDKSLDQIFKDKPSRNVGFFLSKNHERIARMGRRIEQILHLDPKQAFDKWYKLSEFSLENFGPTLNVDEKNPLNPTTALQMNGLVAKHCLPERNLEQWFETDALVNRVSFSTCTASVMCAEQLQQCFNREDSVGFYECLASDKELMKCTDHVIMKNLGTGQK